MTTWKDELGSDSNNDEDTVDKRDPKLVFVLPIVAAAVIGRAARVVA